MGRAAVRHGNSTHIYDYFAGKLWRQFCLPSVFYGGNEAQTGGFSRAASSVVIRIVELEGWSYLIPARCGVLVYTIGLKNFCERISRIAQLTRTEKTFNNKLYGEPEVGWTHGKLNMQNACYPRLFLFMGGFCIPILRVDYSNDLTPRE